MRAASAIRAYAVAVQHVGRGFMSGGYSTMAGL